MNYTKALATLALALATLPGAAAQTPVPASNAAGSQSGQNPGQHAFTAAQQKLKGLRTIFAYSDTAYLDNKVLRDALMKRFEIRTWKIDLAEKDSADVWIKVWRPAFTFDWRYRITDRETGQELGAGRIVAWDGKRAADALAAEIARTIGRVRPLPTRLLGALADDPNARKWELKYEGGSEGPRRGVTMTVSVSPEHIVGRHERRVVFVIPARAISNLSYNTRRVRTDRSKAWEAFWEQGFSTVNDANSAMGALMLLPVVLGVDVLLKQSESTRTQHLCEIAWTEGAGDVVQVRDVTLKAGDGGTIKEFMAAVKEVSHRNATDFAADTAALLQAMEQQNRDGRFAAVQLDRKTAVGWKILEPGAYRVLLVERAPQPSIAYFIPGTGIAAPTNVVAQIPVTMEARAVDSGAPTVRYRDVGGIATLEEITAPGKTLRFRAIPVEFATEPQVSEEMEEVLAQAALRPKYRSLHIKSDTVYLRREVMEKALAQHPGFLEWQMKLVSQQGQAELALVVKRPFLTFEWTYLLTEAKTGNKLAEGRITARDGERAASLIADHIVDALKAKAAQEISTMP